MIKVLCRSLSLCKTKFTMVMSVKEKSTSFTRPAYEIEIKDLHPTTLERLNSIFYPIVVEKEKDIIEVDRWFICDPKTGKRYSITCEGESKTYKFWEYWRVDEYFHPMKWFLIDKIPIINDVRFELHKEWVISSNGERTNYKPVVLEKCKYVENVKF